MGHRGSAGALLSMSATHERSHPPLLEPPPSYLYAVCDRTQRAVRPVRLARASGNRVSSMLFAYADPPYLGCCRLYDHHHGDDGRCWDEPATHELLIARLCES